MKSYRIIVVLLVCLICGLYYFLKRTEKQMTLLQNKVDTEIIELKSANMNLMNNNEYRVFLNYSTLDSMPDVTYSEGYLALKLNPNSCNACYWDAIDSLKKYVRINALPFMVMGTFEYAPGFREKVESLGLAGFPSFNNEIERGLAGVDKYEVPFLFWYHPQGYISDVFFLDKKQSGLVEQYINMLVRKWSLKH